MTGRPDAISFPTLPGQGVVDDLVRRCRLGECQRWSVRGIGQGGTTTIDVDTTDGDYVVELAAPGPLRARLAVRTAEIVLRARVRGVRHPRLVPDRDGTVVHLSPLGTALVLERGPGVALARLGRPPQPIETAAVLEQLALLHTVHPDVEPVFDPNDVGNLPAVAAALADRLDPEQQLLVSAAGAALGAVDPAELPHALVHGDLTKATVLVEPAGAIALTGLGCADRRPRVQDLAALAVEVGAGAARPVQERAAAIADAYPRTLLAAERRALPAFTCATAAMAFLDAVRDGRAAGPALGELVAAVAGLSRT